jgi:hypothetical protein
VIQLSVPEGRKAQMDQSLGLRGIQNMGSSNVKNTVVMDD